MRGRVDLNWPVTMMKLFFVSLSVFLRLIMMELIQYDRNHMSKHPSELTYSFNAHHVFKISFMGLN